MEFTRLSLFSISVIMEISVVDISLGHGISRLTVRELHKAVLGSVPAGWGPLGKDIVAVARFFMALWDRLQRATESTDVGMDERINIDLSCDLLSRFSCIFILYNAPKNNSWTGRPDWPEKF